MQAALAADNLGKLKPWQGLFIVNALMVGRPSPLTARAGAWSDDFSCPPSHRPSSLQSSALLWCLVGRALDERACPVIHADHPSCARHQTTRLSRTSAGSMLPSVRLRASACIASASCLPECVLQPFCHSCNPQLTRSLCACATDRRSARCCSKRSSAPGSSTSSRPPTRAFWRAPVLRLLALRTDPCALPPVLCSCWSWSQNSNTWIILFLKAAKNADGTKRFSVSELNAIPIGGCTSLSTCLSTAANMSLTFDPPVLPLQTSCRSWRCSPLAG